MVCILVKVIRLRRPFYLFSRFPTATVIMTGPNIFSSSKKLSTSPKLHRISESSVVESDLLMGDIDKERNNNSKDVKIVIPKYVETSKKEHPLWIRVGAALFYVIR